MRICATNFSEMGTSDRAIAIGLPLATGGLCLIGGFIATVVVFFVYRHRQKQKLKLKEEADEADMESDADTRPQYKSSYHQANNNLSNSQVASFRRTVGNN
jgi:Na+/glutamate symporter